MDRNAVFAVYERFFQTSDAVTVDGHIDRNGTAFVSFVPWFDTAAIRWYVLGGVPARERLP
jgi:hypothetical protein